MLKIRYLKITQMRHRSYEGTLKQVGNLSKYRDSIKIIRKQVEKYEEFVRERAERLERAKVNTDEAERLQKKIDTSKRKNIFEKLS